MKNRRLKGVNTRISIMRTSRTLQLYSIIFLFFSTFTAAWPWPRWLPELDSLIVRQNSGNGTTSEFPNTFFPRTPSNIPKPHLGKQLARHHPSSRYPQKPSFQQERQPHYSQPKPPPLPKGAVRTKQQRQATHPTMHAFPPEVSRCSHPPPSPDSNTSRSGTS